MNIIGRQHICVISKIAADDLALDSPLYLGRAATKFVFSKWKLFAYCLLDKSFFGMERYGTVLVCNILVD